MADQVRRRAKKRYPVPPAKFKTLDEVADYMGRLYRTLSDNIDDGYGGNVVISTNEPAASDGADGDIWVKTN